jgi:xylose isomerase
VWDFARGCMRTYLILKDKARQFAANGEIQQLLADIRGDAAAAVGAYTPQAAADLKSRTFDRAALAARPLAYERLDQLVVDLLLGV